MLKRTLLASAMLMWPLAAVAETPNLEPGEWEFASTSTAQGDFPIPDQSGTQTECLTEEEIIGAHSGNLGQDEECEFLEREASADGMSYVMSCQDENDGQIMVSGEMRYMQDRYEGNMQVETATPMGNMIMNTVIEGRRLGDC